jgi:hypothetical protein
MCNVLPTFDYGDAPGEEPLMPGKKHFVAWAPKNGASMSTSKKALSSGRYGGRAKEVAARTVMKQHKEKGHNPGK